MNVRNGPAAQNLPESGERTAGLMSPLSKATRLASAGINNAAFLGELLR